jgi:hypothetical protein
VEEMKVRVSDDFIWDCQMKFFDFLSGIGFTDKDGPVPLEICTAIAQALSDASGFRIVLQAGIFDNDKNDPSVCRLAGHVEVSSCDPTLFFIEHTEEQSTDRGDSGGKP